MVDDQREGVLGKGGFALGGRYHASVLRGSGSEIAESSRVGCQEASESKIVRGLGGWLSRLPELERFDGSGSKDLREELPVVFWGA